MDCYKSVFRYPDAMHAHFKAHRSVRGYDGPVYADWVPIDIDSDDLEKAHADARSVLNQMLHRFDVNPVELPCFFSGAKGFHVLIPAQILALEPSDKMPATLKRLVSEMFDDVRIDTAIYDATRIFRLAGTVNSKTGLYKIPLNAEEILHRDLAWILEQAKAPRTAIFPDEVTENEQLRDAYRDTMRYLDKPRPVSAGGPQKRELAKTAKPCVGAILAGVGSGHRNEAAIRLAVHFARQGLPQDVTAGTLASWNARNVPPLPPREVDQAVRSAYDSDYDFGCNDPYLREMCDGRCPFKAAKVQGAAAPDADAKPDEIAARVYDVAQARAKYEEYIRNLQRAKVNLGLGDLDDAMRGISPGEVCQVIARSGVGKTALVLNILRNAAEGGSVPALFFTMEMPLAQVYERMAQISDKSAGAVIESNVLHDLRSHDGYSERLFERVQESYGQVFFVEDDGLDLNLVLRFCRAASERAGAPIRLIAIDYMGRMNGGPGSVYEATSRVAKGIKWLAKEVDAAVVSLHQLSRAGGDGSQRVTIDMARDSGVIEEAADFVIGMWRPELRPQIGANGVPLPAAAEEIVRMALLKNRKGPQTEQRVVFQKHTMTIRAFEEREEPLPASVIRLSDREGDAS